MSDLVGQIQDILRGEISAGAEAIEGERNAAEKIAALIADQISGWRSEVLQCASELQEAANLLRGSLPQTATLFDAAAKRANAAYQQKRDDSHG